MPELEQIVLTAALTLIGGMALFILSEFVRALVVTPLMKYKEQAQITLDRIDYYANLICNHFPAKPTDEQTLLIQQIRSDLRSAATQLSSKYSSISSRKTLARLKLVPSGDSIEKAYKSLIYLHNSILFEGAVDEHNNTRKNHEEIEKIKVALIL